MLHNLRVHHTSSDSILLQLGRAEGGYAKLTAMSLGGDVMADRMMRHFAQNTETVDVTLSRKRDADQFTEAHIDLLEVCSQLVTLPVTVRTALAQLYRRNVIAPLGMCVSARPAKTTANGTVLVVGQGVGAVALEKPPSGVAAVSARVLDYDAEAGLMQVTMDENVVSRAPQDVEDNQQLLVKEFAIGQRVTGRVILAPTKAGGAAVIEVETAEGLSAIGYLVAADEGKNVAAKVGAEVDCVVEFVPNSTLAAIAPFLVVTARKDTTVSSNNFFAPPVIRTCAAPTKRISGKFPWRESDEDEEGKGGNKGSKEDQQRTRKRRMEEAIDAFEREKDTLPNSPDEFKKLLLASPNSSYLWTQYMAYHIGLNQHDEARNVAEKALKTIGVRESKELLNVWVAFMNLENMHGTAESLGAVFRRALQYSDDTLIVHEKLAEVFQNSKKNQQLLSLTRTMCSKFRDRKDVWERLGKVLIDMGKRDQLKKMIKELGSVFNKEMQCLIVTHLAVYEYRHGTVESGRGLFEGLVSKVPKKSDVWSVYLDQEMSLLSHHAPEASSTGTRDIFQRLSTISFQPKVMQLFLTRFMTFEQLHGTAKDVEIVKEKARQYVESRIASAGTA